MGVYPFLATAFNYVIVLQAADLTIIHARIACEHKYIAHPFKPLGAELLNYDGVQLTVRKVSALHRVQVMDNTIYGSLTITPSLIPNKIMLLKVLRDLQAVLLFCPLKFFRYWK